MSSTQEFEGRLASLFALELRRQGIHDVDEWLDRLHTYCSFMPSTPHSASAAAAAAGHQATDSHSNVAAASSSSSGSSSSAGGSRGTRQASARALPSVLTLVMDMTNVPIGDRVAVALCESLIKLDGPQSRRGTAVTGATATMTAAVISEWHIMWRRCGLTDRVLQHLRLLVTGCAKVSVLDVAANHFSSSGCAELLAAAAEVPCDVIVSQGIRSAPQGLHDDAVSGDAHHADDASRTRGVGNALMSTPSLSAHQQQQQQYSSSSFSPPSPHTGPQAGGQSSASPPPAIVAGNRAPTNAESGSTALPLSAVRSQVRRSPSLTATSASVPPSQRSFASGSAEALQRRREELFGRPSAPAASATAAAAAEAAVVAPPSVKRSDASSSLSPAAAGTGGFVSGGTGVGVGRGQESNYNTGSQKKEEKKSEVGSRGVTAPAAAKSSSPPPPPQHVLSPSSSTVVAPAHAEMSHSPFRTTQTAPQSATRSQAGKDVPLMQGTNSNKKKKDRSPSSSSNSSPGNVAREPQTASREPFVDRNDQLDVTANLSPMLDSVLDLSALTKQDGRLRQAHMFGGAETVWDVLSAYELAVEQQQQQQSGVSVDSAVLARLPAALLGSTAFNAITVLNVSRNHLTELCAMPPTLLRLDVSSNELTELSGLHRCTMLTVLNARRNRIRAISGLERNLGIAHLFLGHNAIAAVEGLAHMVLLETLDVTFNQLRTQLSIRMLSLCSGLKHLLLRGNPLVEREKPGFTAVLRNLCPTLLVVDDRRIATAAAVTAAAAHSASKSHPNSGSSAMEKGTSVLSHRAPSTLRVSSLHPDAAGGGFCDATLNTSLPFTSSRYREGSTSQHRHGTHSPRPLAPFAEEDSNNVDAHSLELLRLLTRGVTAPTGYGDSAKSHHTAQQLLRMQKAAAAKESKEKERLLSANGRPIRGAVVKHLAEQSRKYLEETIAHRMMTQQQQVEGEQMEAAAAASRSAAAGDAADVETRAYATPHQRPSPVQADKPLSRGAPVAATAVGGDGGSGSGGVTHSGGGLHKNNNNNKSTASGAPDSPSPARPRARSVMSSTSTAAVRAAAAFTPADIDPNTAEVLRRYALKTKPMRRKSSAAAAAAPRVATTHAAQLRAQSAQRMLSGTASSSSRQQSPARAASMTNAADTEAAAAEKNGEDGEKADVYLDAVYAKQTHRGASKRTGSGGAGGRAYSVPLHTQDADATLDALYVEDLHSHHHNYDNNMAKNASKQSPRSPAATAAPSSSSYAVLHAAERAERRVGSRADRDAAAAATTEEIECSPISKDPQARLLTSLNTTASVFERSDHRQGPTPLSSHRHPQEQPVHRRKHNEGHGTPERNVVAAGGKSRPQRVYAPPPPVSAHPRSVSQGSSNSDSRASQRFTPHVVEETAIYPSSRSGSSNARRRAAAAATPTTVTMTAPRASTARAAQAHEQREHARTSRRHDRQALDGDEPVSSYEGRVQLRGRSPSGASRRSPSLEPLHVDAGQRARVLSWTSQLAEDAAAVQEALRTVVELLEAQRQPGGQPTPESSRDLPPTYLHERQRCLEIIEESGMLADTQVPMNVVVYYGLSKDELNGDADRSAQVATSSTTEQQREKEVAERREVLRLVHLLGDAKTCLRYVALLVGDGREKLLQQYVDQLQLSLRES